MTDLEAAFHFSRPLPPSFTSYLLSKPSGSEHCRKILLFSHSPFYVCIVKVAPASTISDVPLMSKYQVK